ncbi:MAG: PAS domain S-box protein [Rhodospirillales bacterium]|nr:PAS domain S-box protein [Rhodospirillales bacterium]
MAGQPWRRFLERFLPAAVIILVGFAIVVVDRWKSLEDHDYRATVQAIDVQSAMIDASLRSVAADLATISHWVDGDDLNAGSSNIDGKHRLSDALLAFASSKNDYTMFRWVDARDGRELRVERTDDRPVVKFGAVPSGPTNRLDVPFIRIVQRLADEHGNDQGVLTVDLALAGLLDALRRAAPEVGGVMVLDSHGNWIESPNSAVELHLAAKSVIGDPRGTSFAALRPDAWATIRQTGSGLYRDTDGTFLYATLPFPFAGGTIANSIDLAQPAADGTFDPDEGWTIAVFRPDTPISLLRDHLIRPALLAGAMLSLAAVLCLLLGREGARRSQATSQLAEAERALRDSVVFNQTLLENLPTPVFFVDTDGRCLDCNQAFADLVGRARASLVGKSVRDAFSPSEEAAFCLKNDDFFAKPERRIYETSGHDAEGNLRHWLVVKSPLNDAEGAARGLIAITIDVTEHKAAEEVLARSHAFFRQVLDAIPQPVFVKDRQHRMVFVNDAACDFFGYPRERLVGTDDTECFLEEQCAVFRKIDNLVFTHRQVNLNEEVITNAAGREHVILTKKSVIFDKPGNDMLVGIITDITERKEAEKMLLLSAEVFENCSEGILITDDQGIILSVNRALIEMSGYSSDELIGSDARMLSLDRQAVDLFMTITAAVADRGRWKGEVVNRRKNGEIYVVEMPTFAVRDDRGTICRYIALLNDITERKSHEDRIRYLAQHDFLTGLANRALLYDRIEHDILHAQRNARKVAILVLDLDRFKEINDTWGHATGDQLLTQVGQRLRSVVRQTDTVSRFGGDEFAIVLPDVHERQDAERIAAKITAELSRPFCLDHVRAEIGVSLGIAVYPDDGYDREGLCRHADTEMYRTKAQHRNGMRLLG